MDHFQEKKLFERFKRGYNNFPATIEERVDKPQEKPDSIIITTNNKKIGIELTETFQDNENSKSGGSDLKKTEIAYEQIGNSIVEEVDKRSSKKFHLDISFHRNANLRQKNRNKIIKKLTCLILKYLPSLEPRKPLVISDFRKLPDGVIDFCIFNSPEIPKSYFGNSQSAAVKDLTNRHIETVLRDKNEAIKNYENCDEQWLVIKIGNFIAGSFAKNKIDRSFKSKFDKVFIHDIQTSETLELKLQK